MSELNPDGRTESRYGIDGGGGQIHVGRQTYVDDGEMVSRRRKPRIVHQVFVVALYRNLLNSG